MLIDMERAGNVPLYEHLIGQLRGAILRGDVGPGDRLPAARDLAASLGVNRNTILRAYNALCDEGLIHLRRGRGATVSAVSLNDVEWDHAVGHLVAVARKLGMPASAIHAAVDEHLAAEGD